MLINLEGPDIGFDALETDNIVAVWMWLFTQPGVSREPVKGSRCPTTLNLKEPTESSARALSIRQCFCAKIAHADAYLCPLSYSQSWCSPFTPLTHPCSLCHSRQLCFSFFFFFNDTSLREKILMLQIENRPVFFFFSPRVCPFEKVPLTAVQQQN